MKTLYAIITLSCLAFSCEKKNQGSHIAPSDASRTEDGNSWNDPLEAKVLNLLVSSAKVFPDSLKVKEDFAVIMWDGADAQATPLEVSITMGSQKDGWIRRASGVDGVKALLSDIAPDSTIRLYDQCGMPFGYEVPQGQKTLVAGIMAKQRLTRLERALICVCKDDH